MKSQIISHNLWPSRTLSDDLWPPQTISDILGPFQTIPDHLGPSQTFSDHLIQCHTSLHHLTPSWLLSDHIRLSHTISHHLWPSQTMVWSGPKCGVEWIGIGLSRTQTRLGTRSADGDNNAWFLTWRARLVPNPAKASPPIIGPGRAVRITEGTCILYHEFPLHCNDSVYRSCLKEAQGQTEREWSLRYWYTANQK